MKSYSVFCLIAGLILNFSCGDSEKGKEEPSRSLVGDWKVIDSELGYKNGPDVILRFDHDTVAVYSNVVGLKDGMICGEKQKYKVDKDEVIVEASSSIANSFCRGGKYKIATANKDRLELAASDRIMRTYSIPREESEKIISQRNETAQPLPVKNDVVETSAQSLQAPIIQRVQEIDVKTENGILRIPTQPGLMIPDINEARLAEAQQRQKIESSVMPSQVDSSAQTQEQIVTPVVSLDAVTPGDRAPDQIPDLDENLTFSQLPVGAILRVNRKIELSSIDKKRVVYFKLGRPSQFPEGTSDNPITDGDFVCSLDSISDPIYAIQPQETFTIVGKEDRGEKVPLIKLSRDKSGSEWDLVCNRRKANDDLTLSDIKNILGGYIHILPAGKRSEQLE